MNLPEINSPNPATNPILTRLKKPQVDLWAIPLQRYVKDGAVESGLKEFQQWLAGTSQYKELEDVTGEFSPAHVFGSDICFPFIRKNRPYMVFIPDHMTTEERERFLQSTSAEEIPVTKFNATKAGRKWLIAGV